MSQEVVETTKNYYDSDDADEFYYNIWGGEDIHVGIYTKEGESIFDASQRSVEKLASFVDNVIDENTKVLDIGAGYGGTARFFVKKYGCHVDCLNLSDKENERNRNKNKDQGLDDKIEVYGGNFEELPFEDDTYDVVIAQDAILHSGNKEKVFEETARVMKDGGDFAFTDPMQADDCPPDVLNPVLERIHLDSMGSVKQYRDLASKFNMKEIAVEEMPDQLVNHYSSVRQQIKDRYDEITKVCGKDYIDKMIEGLGHWVEKGKKGYLNWGFLHFKK
ncbi:MAG: cyclopropane-fatty-acyl-phospholipid synthase family protein [Flavobacteriales bacterium]